MDNPPPVRSPGQHKEVPAGLNMGGTTYAYKQHICKACRTIGARKAQSESRIEEKENQALACLESGPLQSHAPFYLTVSTSVPLFVSDCLSCFLSDSTGESSETN